MRWEALFDDMESQFAEADRLALDAEVNERTRAELVNQQLEDRLRAALGYRIGIHLSCGESVHGEVMHVGADALLLNEEHQQVLIPFNAAARYVGLGRSIHAETSPVRRSIGLAHSLRCLARDRAELSVSMGGGAGIVTLYGVIDRVGKDYIDLATLNPGEVRRSRNVGQVSTIPFTALAMLRSSKPGGP